MKKILITLMLIVFMFLVGCGNKVKNEKEIQSDLGAYLQSDFDIESEKIVSVTIDKRQTEKEQKMDMVWCTVKTEDEGYAYEKNAILLYVLYDEGGWLLEEVSINERNEWIIEPINGISYDEVVASLVGTNISVNNQIWQITNENIKSATIEEQETNLEEKKDKVILTLVIEDTVQEASGQLTIDYSFNNAWSVDSITGNDVFTAQTKPGMETNVTEESIINVLQGTFFVFGEGDFTQQIAINKDEISGLIINNQQSESMGKVEKYLCNCKLSKPYVEFMLDIEVQYTYSDKWDTQINYVNAECISTNLEGNWVGTMFDEICELNITEKKEDGSLTGTYTYYNGEGSYYVSGKIDKKTLAINLEAGDEIIVGINVFGNAYGTSDIEAKLNVDDSSISGMARRSFIVAR